MLIVTGAAGFIGSNIVHALNARGITEILAVDDFSRGEDAPNLRGAVTATRMPITDFRRALAQRRLPVGITGILHQGACADTMQMDRAYMMDANCSASEEMLAFAMEREIPLVYASSASVYGTNRASTEIPANEAPINVYAESKLAFDNWLRPRLAGISSTVVGLRYFNVYGPREARKGRMASMVFQICRRLLDTGVIRLFEGTDGFGPGEQRRDFIHVDDVAAVNLHFLQGPPCQGICNVGTGASRSFNDVARIAMEHLGRGRIEYIPFPEELRGKYQSFTEADLTALRAAGYGEPMLSLEAGMARAWPVWQAGG